MCTGRDPRGSVEVTRQMEWCPDAIIYVTS